MSNQITKTTEKNYNPALSLGFGVDTNDITSYFRNAVTSAPGLGVSGGASNYSVGNALNYTILAGTTTTVTNAGLTVSTGNTGETTGTGTGFPPTFGTGSDLGTTAPYTAALADVAALRTTLIGLTGTSITANAAALDAYNAGNGLGVFTPGVYTTSSAIGVTASKTITLSGAGDYVFISTGGAITFGATDVINLTNGATPGRVWWVSDAAITTGATCTLAGNFLSTAATITIGSTNIIRGRLLSPAAITIDGTASTFSLPATGSGSALAASTNTFGVRVHDTLGVPVTATNMPSLATATDPNGNIAGNLAFDNGTVPQTTGACRMYTFLCDVNKTTGATTLSVVCGFDFPKIRPVNVTTDVNLGDGDRAIVGYLYVKNETSAVFVPGTTVLNTTGITTTFSDGFGFMSYNAAQ